MWKLKTCPRCGGDVFLDSGLDTWCEHCLQCGYQRELSDIREFYIQPEREKEPVLAKIARPPEKQDNQSTNFL